MKYRITVSMLAVCMAAVAEAQAPATAANDTITLKEVVVKASQPISKIEGDGMVTTVAGTVLQSLGSAKDVLGYIPGVVVNDGSVEVFGKGKPVIYINGRKMLDYGEIDRLRSERVKNIKVITNPGARYDSSVNSVIRITTLKEQGEGYALDSKSTLGYRDYLHGKETLWMNYRTGGLDLFSNLEYSNTRQKGTSLNRLTTWGKEHGRTDLSMNSKSRTQLYDGQLGFNYVTDNDHSFGVYYRISHTPTKTRLKSNSIIHADDKPITATDMSQHRDVRYREHLVDGYYSGMWGKWSADITFDLMWRNNREIQNSLESSDEGTRRINIHDKYRSRMTAFEMHLSRGLWKGNINVGTEYTNSHRDQLSIDKENVIADNDDKINENNIGVYGEIVQNFGRVMLMAGVRYEHVDSRYYDHGVKQNGQSRKYDEILPSATITVPVKSAMFQLGYSRKYMRPLYSQLSSAIDYVNQNLYESGNPMLKSSYSDNLSLNIRWKWLMIMANYRHVTDRIITSAYRYGDNPDVTLLKKDNSSRPLDNFQFMASVMPGFIGKFYYPVLSFGVMAQWYKIDYRRSLKSMNRPIPIVRFNNIFRLPEDYTLRCDLSWRGKGDGENVRLSSSWQINLTAQKVLDKHWDLKLAVNDIFNTSRKTRFILYSDVRDVISAKCNTSRNIEFTVGYKFNVTKSKYKGKGAGESEKERH